MSDQRHRHVTRASAEQIFDNVAYGTSSAGDPVSELLAAVMTLPAAPDTDGERRALAALRAARPSATAATVPARRRRWAGVLTAKAAVVTVAILAGSGIAVAAGTTGVPGLFDGRHISGRRHSHGATMTPTASATSPSAPSPSSATQPATAGLIAQCRAYIRLSSADRGKALDEHGFAALVRAAGDRDQIDGFCTALLAAGTSTTTPTPKPNGKPSHPPHPTPQPTPHGKPTAHGTPTTQR